MPPPAPSDVLEAMLSLPVPRHMPCDRCGASVAREDVTHMCNEERRLDFAFFQLRTEIETFEEQLGCWLETPQGRFERYDAERTRPA